MVMRLINVKSNNLFSNYNFKHLFGIQSLAAMNDNIIKNSLIIVITYFGLNFLGLSKEQLVTFSLFLFVLPLFLFSSYAGKLADYGDKVKIIRFMKIFEIIIMICACIAYYYENAFLMLICIFCLGLHSAIFGPIKYSIISQYLPKSKIVLAIGYIEFGTFVGILLGQLIGTWFMVIDWRWFMMGIALISSCIGLYSSYRLKYVPALLDKQPKYYINPFKDTYLAYKFAVNNIYLKKNLHAISWFWAFGAIFTTHLVIFIMLYLCNDGKAYSIILIAFTLGIGLGSVICAKLSKGMVIHKYALYGGVTVSIGVMALLFYNSYQVPSSNSLEYFLSHKGIVDIVICFIIGNACGMYSVTAYAELQLLSPDSSRSQIISANNILNSFYMTVASIISGLMLLIINVWWLFFILAIINVWVVYRYYLFNRKDAININS